MTYPTFSRTGWVNLSISRYALGDYSTGDYVKATPTIVTVRANVQPLKDREIVQMPEADRTKKWLKVYSASLMRSNKEGEYDADRFIWDGDTYQVEKVQDYSMGVLNHWRATACKISPNP